MKKFDKDGLIYGITFTTGLGASLLGKKACTLHKWAGLEDERHSNTEMLHLLQCDERFEREKII